MGTSRTVGVPLAAPGVPATQWTQSPAPSKWTLEHSVRDDYVCNILLDDLVISSGSELDVDNVARVPDQQLSLDCFTHAMIDDSRMFPRSVLQADTIIVSCGLAKFERISWSMQRCHKLGELRDEPRTTADYDKFLESFEDNHPGACDGRSMWMVDNEKLDDSDKDTRTWRYMLVETRGSWSLFRDPRTTTSSIDICMWEYHPTRFGAFTRKTSWLCNQCRACLRGTAVTPGGRIWWQTKQSWRKSWLGRRIGQM